MPRRAPTARLAGPGLATMRAEILAGDPWEHGGSRSDVLNELIYGHNFFGGRPSRDELETVWTELRGDILVAAEEHGADRPAAWWWEQGEHPPTPHADACHGYARSIVAGEIVASRWVRLACQRHLDDLEQGPDRGLTFDAREADRAVHCISMLRLFKGEFKGQRMRLDPWHKFVVCSLFGWHAADGFRRFRRGYVEVARGMAKSHLAAGIEVYGTFLEGEGGAEGYSAATKSDQAKIVLNVARKMALKSRLLSRILDVREREIRHEESDSFMVALSREYDSLDGLNPHIAVIDELHAHTSRGILDVLEEGARKRRQSLVFMITTAGDGDGGATVCRDERDYCTDVLESVGRGEDPSSTDHVFAYIACLDSRADGAEKDDDWRDDSLWIKANPSLGTLMSAGELLRARDDAIRMPSRQTSFRRKHCNLWVGSPDSWLPDGAWAACGADPESIDLVGRPCWGGLDLSKRIDLTAFVLCFPLDDGRHVFLPRFWMPEERIFEREMADRKPYRLWVEQGHITATPGNVIDYRMAAEQIRKDAEEFSLLGVGFDAHLSWKLAPELQDEGYQMVEVRQGTISLSEPMKELEALVLDGKAVHFANPVMDWMVGCVTTRTDVNDNVAPDKKKSKGKIDGVLAAIMALKCTAVQDAGGNSLEQALAERGMIIA